MATLYTKTAALYSRVSSQEQAQHGLSLGEQRIDLEQYAKKRNYKIYDYYTDEGCSARRAISRRHELQRLIRDVEAGLIDVIISKSLDRLTRNVQDFYKLKEIFDKHGVTLEFTRERDYSTDTSSGRLMLNLRLAIAQNESDQTSDRIRYVFAGMRRDKRIISGNVPFGYRIENKKVVVEPHEAEIIRYIFSSVIGGQSVYSLMESIYDKFGVSLKYDRLLWITKNENYTGKFWDVENLAEPIISKEDFKKAREVLSRRPLSKQKGRVHLFSGMLKCPVCGRNLCVSNYYGRTVYKCQNHIRATRKNNIACSWGSGISENRVEDFLVENISRIIADNVRTTKTKMHNKEKSYQTLGKVARSLERLNEIYVMGNIEKEAYRQRYEALKKQERILLSESNTKAIKIPAVLRGDSFPTVYETWSREERRAFWQGLIKRIEIPNEPRNKWTPLNLSVYFFD